MTGADYALLLVLPIVGWKATSAYSGPIMVSGWPPICPEDRLLSEQPFWIHGLIGTVIAGLVVIHIGVAYLPSSPFAQGHAHDPRADIEAGRPKLAALHPSTWRVLPKHVQLMTQNHNFGFKPRWRLEAVAQDADQKEGSCDHPAIMI